MYEEKFGEDLKLNTALLKLTEDGKAHEDEVAKDWLKKNDILSGGSLWYYAGKENFFCDWDIDFPCNSGNSLS